jgi:hypothetical protein
MSIKNEGGVVTIDGDDLKKLQAEGREYLESVRPPEGTPALSEERTPYAVICREHGQQFLTSDEYNRQLCRPDSLWTCPKCGEASNWDDDNYEASFGDPPDDWDPNKG